jgi:hypothetical protein
MLRGPLHYGKDYSVFSEFDSESDSLVRAGTQAQRHMVMTNDKLFNKKDGEQTLPSLVLVTDESGPLEQLARRESTGMKVLHFA